MSLCAVRLSLIALGPAGVGKSALLGHLVVGGGGGGGGGGDNIATTPEACAAAYAAIVDRRKDERRAARTLHVTTHAATLMVSSPDVGVTTRGGGGGGGDDDDDAAPPLTTRLTLINCPGSRGRNGLTRTVAGLSIADAAVLVVDATQFAAAADDADDDAGSDTGDTGGGDDDNNVGKGAGLEDICRSLLSAYTLGITRLVVAVSHMDAVTPATASARRSVFLRCVRVLAPLIERYGYDVRGKRVNGGGETVSSGGSATPSQRRRRRGGVAFVPVSAAVVGGVNIGGADASSSSSSSMSPPPPSPLTPWYRGPSVAAALAALRAPTRLTNHPLRFCVRAVTPMYNNNDNGNDNNNNDNSDDEDGDSVPSSLLLRGRIETGVLRVGDSIVAAPMLVAARVRSIEVHGQRVDAAAAGELVGIVVRLHQPVQHFLLRRGNVIGHSFDHVPSANAADCGGTVYHVCPPARVVSFTVQLVVLDAPLPLRKGYMPSAAIHAQRCAVRIKLLSMTVDKHSGKPLKSGVPFLNQGEAAMVKLAPKRASSVETFAFAPRLGRLLLYDAGRVVAVGVIMSVNRRVNGKIATFIGTDGLPPSIANPTPGR
jgi:translation elongation factor EF-1alpha